MKKRRTNITSGQKRKRQRSLRFPKNRNLSRRELGESSRDSHKDQQASGKEEEAFRALMVLAGVGGPRCPTGRGKKTETEKAQWLSHLPTRTYEKKLERSWHLGDSAEGSYNRQEEGQHKDREKRKECMETRRTSRIWVWGRPLQYRKRKGAGAMEKKGQQPNKGVFTIN